MRGGRELVESMLPHRPPLLLVDAIEDFKGGARPVLEASFEVTGEEAWLRGHFPGRPIWPGALLIEGLAQCAGLVIHVAAAHARGEQSVAAPPDPSQLGVLAAANIKLLKVVEPPVRLRYRVRLVGVFGGLYRVEGEVVVGDRAVADGTVSIAIAGEGAASG